MAKKPRAPNGTGWIHEQGYRVIGSQYEHILVAERVLGKPLPKGAVVHHVNENRLDNRPENLVICPSRAYHNLLHKRMDAKEATGNPNLIKCCYCHQWDTPDMVPERTDGHRSRYHKKCGSEYSKLRRSREKLNAALQMP